VQPGVVDAARCLAWLLQKPGIFDRRFRRALGDRMYGCDECQEVCPPNRRTPRREPTGEEDPWVDLLVLLDPDDDVVLARAGRWYIPRREVRYVRRNALVVLGNVGDGRDPEVAEVLRRHLAHDDPLLRGHAVWAARRLGREDLVADVVGADDPVVAAELAASVPPR
jgi:epoxyqueuosine reductase